MHRFYIIFHGNLAFSAIEEQELADVIDRCYFPLLQLIDETQIPMGLELSAYTLENILHYRPEWVTQFKTLHSQGLLELVGSGYMQIIGPLVPYAVNVKNQNIGLDVYQSILGIKPEIAYVNEQTFSKSMVDLYHDAGYQCMVMEWNNAFSKHPQWDKKFSYTPITVQGLNSTLEMLWTDSIVFQHFQRTAQGENSIDEYLSRIANYLEAGNLNIPVYTSDLEIFNYRPGRFDTECVIKQDEWARVKQIVLRLSAMGQFSLPGQIRQNHSTKKVSLDLSSAETPIVVKKQSKYSLSRWAACGRGATYINRLCFNAYQMIRQQPEQKSWKKLLQYWGSDFRTHITEKKWQAAIQYLTSYQPAYKSQQTNLIPLNTQSFQIQENDKNLSIKTKDYEFNFLLSKGLCLDSVTSESKKMAVGTVKHGDLEHIIHGADFYTGTTVIEAAETGRVTDLTSVQNYQLKQLSAHQLRVSAKIQLQNIGFLQKNWIIDIARQSLGFYATLTLNQTIRGSIRMGCLTLVPRNKAQPFWYQVKNGGSAYEKFYVDKTIRIEHQKAQNLLQSSQGGLGLTDGTILFGDENGCFVCLEVDQSKSYPFVMLQNEIDYDNFLTRLFFSLQELDDTSKESTVMQHTLAYTLFF